MISTLRYAIVFFCLGVPFAAASEPLVRRDTPIVRAVAKVRSSVVALKVVKRDDWGTRSLQGTGIIVDERGYLITNHHVAEKAEKIIATLSDGTQHEARVHFEDVSHDLAILRLPTAKKLPALRMGPGSDLMLGETIIAVGNPFGYAGTVTTGIVSGLDREITMPSGEKLRKIVQTNAAINPGNSGGPLLNINGEVIGVVVALRDGAQCMAFALNSETVKVWLARHLSAAKVSKVAHGLRTTEVIAAEGRDRQTVVVKDVAGRATASRLGLKKGDVIKKIGSLEVQNRFDVERAVWGYKSGDRIEANVVRDGKPMTVSLTVTGDREAVLAASSKD